MRRFMLIPSLTCPCSAVIVTSSRSQHSKHWHTPRGFPKVPPRPPPYKRVHATNTAAAPPQTRLPETSIHTAPAPRTPLRESLALKADGSTVELRGHSHLSTSRETSNKLLGKRGDRASEFRLPRHNPTRGGEREAADAARP
ncbi:hypothetical protein C8T65DRAFT_92528 [Cerioporus squamosus]|nr:hypothetical protein C8T65DRAFT_92528 [Cerioporus squamosus]